jgi:predicted transcriptional regulator
MSKKSVKTVTKVAPVTTPAPVASETGRTIVEIARELKVTPQNARRVARKHAEALGHAGKGARWVLSPDQQKTLIDALTRELKQPAA